MAAIELQGCLLSARRGALSVYKASLVSKLLWSRRNKQKQATFLLTFAHFLLFPFFNYGREEQNEAPQSKRQQVDGLLERSTAVLLRRSSKVHWRDRRSDQGFGKLEAFLHDQTEESSHLVRIRRLIWGEWGQKQELKRHGYRMGEGREELWTWKHRNR